MANTHDRLALGIDGGGTKSDAVLIDETGNVLGWGRGGTGQMFWAGRHAALEAFAGAVKAALAGRSPRTIWIAGLWQDTYEAMGLGIEEPHFVPASEVSMGLAAALETHGLLVLSGTGSFVAGVTEDGRRLVLDGLGPVLGDHGSGYQIGLMGMRAAMASCWSSERRTMLEQLVPEALGVTSLHHLFELVYSQQIGRSRIASAAKAVVRAAEAEDAVARKIVLRAADDISDVLADVIGSLDLREADCALVASGGIAQNCELYWNRVCERALEIAPHLRPVCPEVRPCVGAALLALKAMGIPWTRELLARIEETQIPHLAAIGSSQPSGKGSGLIADS